MTPSSIPLDQDPKLAQYAHPERLVTTEWLAAHLDDPGLVVVESDEDVLLYDTGHIPGAVKLDWHTELNDPVTRDYVDGAGLRRSVASRGSAATPRSSSTATRTTGGRRTRCGCSRCSATRTCACSTAAGPSGSPRAASSPPTTPKPAPVDYPVVERDDAPIRAFKDDVLAHLGRAELIDVRSPGEYTGELLHMPDYPQEGALRGGHIPGATSVPWARAAAEDATFKTARRARGDLPGASSGLAPDDDVIAYCRIGERSSHTWFVLTHLLGFEHVRNYDGSWTEWGNTVRVPIVAGTSPGSTPARAGPPPAATPAAGDRRRLRGVPDKDRLQLLLEFSQDLPPLPERYADAPATGWSRSPSARRRCSWRWRSSRTRRVHLYFDGPGGGADHPRLRVHPARRARRPARRRGAGHPGRVLRPARAGRAGEPAAAARHGRDAVPDQAPGAGEGGRLAPVR